MTDFFVIGILEMKDSIGDVTIEASLVQYVSIILPSPRPASSP